MTFYITQSEIVEIKDRQRMFSNECMSWNDVVDEQFDHL